MIYATILICSSAFPICTEEHAYRSFRGGEYRAMNDCLVSTTLSMPLVPHNAGDSFRIVCGGRRLDLGKEA